MFVYNITVKVNYKIEQEWMRWQKEIYIPRVMDTELFYAYEFYLLVEHNDAEGRTFVMQFFAESRDRYDEFVKQYAVVFYEENLKKWGDAFINFRTLLQSVK